MKLFPVLIFINHYITASSNSYVKLLPSWNLRGSVHNYLDLDTCELLSDTNDGNFRFLHVLMPTCPFSVFNRVLVNFMKKLSSTDNTETLWNTWITFHRDLEGEQFDWLKNDQVIRIINASTELFESMRVHFTGMYRTLWEKRIKTPELSLSEFTTFFTNCGLRTYHSFLFYEYLVEYGQIAFISAYLDIVPSLVGYEVADLKEWRRRVLSCKDSVSLKEKLNLSPHYASVYAPYFIQHINKEHIATVASFISGHEYSFDLYQCLCTLDEVNQMRVLETITCPMLLSELIIEAESYSNISLLTLLLPYTERCDHSEALVEKFNFLVSYMNYPKEINLLAAQQLRHFPVEHSEWVRIMISQIAYAIEAGNCSREVLYEALTGIVPFVGTEDERFQELKNDAIMWSVRLDSELFHLFASYVDPIAVYTALGSEDCNSEFLKLVKSRKPLELAIGCVKLGNVNGFKKLVDALDTDALFSLDSMLMEALSLNIDNHDLEKIDAARYLIRHQLQHWNLTTYLFFYRQHKDELVDVFQNIIYWSYLLQHKK